MTKRSTINSLRNVRQLSGRITELDGLRGIAISLVVLWHFVVMQTTSIFVYPLRSAWSGVDLFFVLSGFLIAGVLLDARSAENFFSVFYMRRFYRILPLYIIFIILALPLSNVPNKWTWLAFAQNINMYLMPGMALANGNAALSVTWSLAVEEQFYFLLPAAARFLSRRALTWSLVAWAAASPLLRYAMHVPSNLEWVLLFGRGDSLGLGALCAILLRSKYWSTVSRNAVMLLAAILALFPFGLWAMQHKWLTEFSPKFTILGLVYSCLLVLALTKRFALLTWFLNVRPLQYIGKVSYFVYLFHAAMWVLFGKLTSKAWADAVIATAATLLVAHYSWKYLESPLIKGGHRWKYRQKNDPLRIPENNPFPVSPRSDSAFIMRSSADLAENVPQHGSTSA